VATTPSDTGSAAPVAPPPPTVAAVAAAAAAPADAAETPPLTLSDVAELGRESDYSAFVSRGVSPDVKNAALKKLFTDPHYNVMDGLDIYIEDYGKPDPLPAGMLRQMVQSKLLGLFAEEDAAEARAHADSVASSATAAEARAHADSVASSATAPAAAGDESPVAALPDPSHPDTAPSLERAPHEDPAVQLQPDDDAGCAGAETGPGADAGRQH
jgi:hypothetical protein